MKLASVFCLVLIAMTGCGSGGPDLAAVRDHITSDQLALSEPVANSVGMVLVPIPAGEFQMGIAEKKKDKKHDDRQERPGPESPQHRVKLTKPFLISAYEVTQQQYEQVTGTRPWEGKPLIEEGPNYPATYITWDDAVAFCQKLSEQEGVEYRLPTEAEWEYACRAGTTTTWSFGDDGKVLGDFAWFDANAYKVGEQYPHRVGQKEPNPLGLYDMHGNVWEWCQDWYAPYDSGAKELVDPVGPKKGRFRVWRGGSFADAGVNTRSGTRVSFGRANYRPEYLAGFRVVRDLEE